MELISTTNELVRRYALLSFTALTCHLASPAYGQLPELSSPSTISANPTSAKFFGGATADDGISFGNAFAYDQLLDVYAEVQVEDTHVNTVGNLYLLIAIGETFFMRDELGAYYPWDLTLPNLLPTSPAKTLQSSEPLTIVEGLAFGPAGLSDATIAIYLAYDSGAAPEELYYSGSPLAFFIAAQDNEPISPADPESPQDGLAAIIALYKARDFETLILERYTELYKAENPDQITQLIASYQTNLATDSALNEVVELLESIDPDSVVLSTDPNPQSSETGQVASFTLGDQQYVLYLQNTGKWGFHI